MVYQVAVVVDDDKDVRDAVCRYFGTLDIKCITTGDGISALRLIMDVSPVAAFVDLHLPAMDGISVLRRIREVRPYTKVVMMSAGASDIEINDALSIGAYRFLLKPWGLYDLDTVIREMLFSNLPDLPRIYRALKYIHFYQDDVNEE